MSPWSEHDQMLRRIEHDTAEKNREYPPPDGWGWSIVYRYGVRCSDEDLLVELAGVRPSCNIRREPRERRNMTEQPKVHAHGASDATLRWFVPQWKWQVTLSWTNWTFGVYWGKIGRKYMIGIDLGPLEIVRVRSFIRSERAKHRPRR